jgi:hypothetical protein
MPRNQDEYCQNPTREGNDEYRLLNAKPTSPKFLAAVVREFSTKSNPNAAVSAITAILATFSAVPPSVTSNSVNSAAATNPRNIATTTRQFIKTRIKFKTSEPKSLAIFQNNHAHHRRISHGTQDEKAEKQLFQIREHNYK